MTSSPIVTGQRERQSAPASTASLTPAMRQYVEQKQRVGDAVLLFRMGDFYETFYEDAVLCSKVLGIALTSRNKGSDNPIPLAGIPYHALDGYLKKLVVAGYRVAVSEQLEDPKQAKGVVHRDVVRIVTAGTLTDDTLLDRQSENLLAALCVTRKGAGIAFVELVGGKLEVVDTSHENLLDELVRARPAELLIADDSEEPARDIADQLAELCQSAISRRPAHEFTPHRAIATLHEHFSVTTLAGFGFADTTPALRAAGAAIQYLQETQKTSLDHIASISERVGPDHMQIDHSTWRSLEIERTLRDGGKHGTLVHAIDRTVHPIGARTLRRWLRNPLARSEPIRKRQEAVAVLVEDEPRRTAVRGKLKHMADVERIAGRVALSRATPRDLAALALALDELPGLADLLSSAPSVLLEDAAGSLTGLDELAGELTGAMASDPPMTVREGGIIADGFDSQLDRLRAIARDAKSWLADYQAREAKRTGIATLKLSYNRVFGYYIEIPNSARGDVPGEYVRRQTVKNAERYITEELKNYETQVLSAKDRANELEFKLFEQLRETVATEMKSLMRVAGALGQVDCVAGLAELACERRFVRPRIHDERVLEIESGRHPVLDQTLGDSFVPNDTQMSPDGFVFIITGPNMAGKSTYIRQVALMTLLAQIGSYVPARSMRWSLVDRLFARVGSSDEIMRGQSTFMVEMAEAAVILHNATERSLVVLDELGRGTSTFDGLALAWAITEHLAGEIGCRTLVATHYHEMIELANLLRVVRNYNVAVREFSQGEEEGVAFLHQIVEGGASKSYGVHVARLAGIPKTVIARSREVLEELQRGFERESRSPQLSRKKDKEDNQLPLFRAPGEELIEELDATDPQHLTPIEALQRIAQWKQRFGQ